MLRRHLRLSAIATAAMLAATVAFGQHPVDLQDFAPLPPRLDLVNLTALPDRAVLFMNAENGFSTFGLWCEPDAGGNGFAIQLVSPVLVAYGDDGTLVLFHERRRVADVELSVYHQGAGSAASVASDADERSILEAMDAYERLDLVLSSDGAAAEAHWSFATAELRDAIADVACIP